MSSNTENTQGMSENCKEQPDDYLTRAAEAYALGDNSLAIHLYLAAFERATSKEDHVDNDAIVQGLKEAWRLACEQKDRSIAEHILGKMEAYLTSEELKAYTIQLQDLALDKLEEIGLARADLETIAQNIAREAFGLETPPQIRIDAIRQVNVPFVPQERGLQGNASDTCVCTSDEKTCACHHDGADNQRPNDVEPTVLFPNEEISYRTLVGFEETVKVMRTLGVGMSEDPTHQQLVETLNARHGLEDSPSPDTLLFRSPAREDASLFMEATLGELGLPGVRMHIEENWQGVVMLCLSAQKSKEFTFNTRTSRFEGRGVLLLEDIDLWEFPQPAEPEDALNAFMFAQMSRGAREAVNLVRAAVMSPDVYVLATASSDGPIEPFLLELLGPLTEVDISYPTPGERAALWIDLAKKHPSMRAVNRVSLVRFSANLARYDICMAARDAVEDAYKQGLRAGKYLPVQPYNLFEKLAAYQPLDSKEYHELEDALIRDFSRGLNANDISSKGH